MKFQSSVSGWVAGVRFYKGAGNTGTHTGSLWTASRHLLATGTFTNETASGWQTLTFANPVQISANTTYVASYYAPNGHYADDQDLFDSAAEHRRRLTAPASRYTATGGGNGVFNVGRPGLPHLDVTRAPSYGVDVIFDTTQPPGAPPAVTASTPYPGSSSNPVTTDPTVTFSQAGGAKHGLVHGEGLDRERGPRHDVLRQHRHGRHVHADQPAGGRHHVHRHRQRGAGPVRPGHGAVHLHVHHRKASRRRPVPLQHLA